jgi:hypothetical protein
MDCPEFVKWIRPALNMEKSIQKIGDFKMKIQRLSYQQYRAQSDCDDVPASVALYT